MIEQLWLIPLGFAAGMLGSMVGLGGGIVIVPVLTFLGYPPAVVASSGLFATLSNAAASCMSYSRQKKIEYAMGIRLGLLSIPGTILGAMISDVTSPEIFKIFFGVALIGAAAYMLLKRKIKDKEKTTSRQVMVLAVGLSFFAGLISAFFGIGGGIVFVPLMVVGIGMAMKRAAPTSQMILLFVSGAGIVAHTMLGHPDFVQAGLLSVGAFLGGTVGARLSQKVSERFLQILISAAMLIVAVELFLEGATGNSLIPVMG